MFGPVSPTQFDLQFSLFGIPVRVLPWFWLMAAFYGWPLIQVDETALLLWIFAVFVSILVHEFGHALTAQHFGYPPQVLLYQFGGLAMYSPYRDYTLWRSILITAAGPAAGLVLGGLSYAAEELAITYENRQQAEVVPEGLYLFLDFMQYVNIYWSLLNLLPVLPLDGGQITRDVLLLITPARGLRIALTISVIVGAGMAIYGFTSDQIYLAVMFGAMAAGSMQELQQRRW